MEHLSVAVITMKWANIALIHCYMRNSQKVSRQFFNSVTQLLDIRIEFFMHAGKDPEGSQLHDAGISTNLW